MASFAELLGTKLPAGAGMDSRPMLPSWLGKKHAPDREYVLEQAANKTLSLRSKDWKYIEPSNGGPMITWGPKIETGYLSRPQLYNMKTDVTEQHNVAEEHPDLVRYFEQALVNERSKQR